MNNSDLGDPNWFQYVLGGFVAILAWLGKTVHRKASNAVSRAELKEHLREMREERMQMHEENRETLTHIHKRVDELYRDSYRGDR